LDASKIIRAVSYLTASIVLIFGVMLLTGFLMPESIPLDFRIIMGVIVILYGIYRTVIIFVKQRNEKDAE